LEGAYGPRDAGSGDHDKIVHRGTSLENKPHFVEIVDRPKEEGRGIRTTHMDFRTALDKEAHHLQVRVHRGTHESSFTRFIPRVRIRSLLEQMLHLRSVAVADGVKECLVQDALIWPRFRHGRGMRSIECPNGEK